MTTKIKPLNLLGLEPNMALTAAPNFEWVDPKTLLVDGGYQRNLGRDSITLIRKIINNWDWRKFKPPVCAMTERGFEIIDGQHTPLAAASHPGIDRIPIMVIEATEKEERARSFVGHNKDRLALTPGQMHYASLAAQDPDAVDMQTVADNAGVELLRFPVTEYKPGQTMAYASIRSLIKRHGVMNARIVLQALVEARQAPIRSDYIKAVEELLFSKEYKDHVNAKSISNEIVKRGPQLNVDAALFATAHNVQTWRALAVQIFKGARRKRGQAIAPAA